MINIQKYYETLTDIVGSLGIGNSSLFKEFKLRHVIITSKLLDNTWSIFRNIAIGHCHHYYKQQSQKMGVLPLQDSWQSYSATGNTNKALIV